MAAFVASIPAVRSGAVEATVQHAQVSKAPQRANIRKRDEPLAAARTFVAGSSRERLFVPLRSPVAERPAGPNIQCAIQPAAVDLGMPLDVLSRLFGERIVLLGQSIDDELANVVVGQLLHLASEDDQKDIKLLVQSPGGSVTAGMAIYDTMNYVNNDVSTICMGLAASMGAFLLSGGAPGKRFSLPNARIMIHQPLGGASGVTEDVEIQVREILHHKKTLSELMAIHCNQAANQIVEDTERDNFMSPYEALRYGLIDGILESPGDA
eukprot:tig00021522_g22096.t1